MPTSMLAHGGAFGAAFEMGFIVVPILVFVVLSRISKRRQEAEEGDDTGEPDEADGTVT